MINFLKNLELQKNEIYILTKIMLALKMVKTDDLRTEEDFQ